MWYTDNKADWNYKLDEDLSDEIEKATLSYIKNSASSLQLRLADCGETLRKIAKNLKYLAN